MSSFGPIVALDNLGSTLQNTFAAGNRVLDILDEQPVTKDITGCEEVEFNCAATENVTFSYGEETIISDVSIPVLKEALLEFQEEAEAVNQQLQSLTQQMRR